ncbi:MAG TPA: squalene--hopene cyclase [Candidatus Acidoferrales bacterium]|nr:squalene--hopene cyclase [Candidatus Acidoferrales bacterium]
MALGAKVEFDPSGPAAARVASPGLDQALHEAVERAAGYLLSLQAPEGYWVGELEADTTLESDYIFYLNILRKAEPSRIARLATYVRRHQLDDGGWSIYQGGPSEVNATVKAYVALQLAGDFPDASHMARARDSIRRLGGLEKTNSFTRFYLALVGAIGWDLVPAVPPEMMLLPSWFYLNIYEMSSWTRAIVIPMAILYHYKPCWAHAGRFRVDDLFATPNRKLPSFQFDRQLITWRNFFLVLDRACKLYERLPWRPLRHLALRLARQWMREHLERSDGLAAIYPAMMNSVFALLALGHGPNDPLTAREIGQMARFEIEEGDTLRVQPCLSPVWDTAIAMVGLEEAGLPPDHTSLVQASRWLLENQLLGAGDWVVKNRDAEPGGWAFEFRNDFYPDVDDTAFVLMALQRVQYPDAPRMERAIRRGIAWLLSMQNRDGGWGAFDRDNDCSILTQVPFADHNAMIDPSTADVTARVVECLGRFGWPCSHTVIKRALAFLLRDQAEDGSWYGRWGSNYVYGTSGVLRSLEPIRLASKDFARRGVDWLCSVQNPDGGWGESLASYHHPELKGRGPSTPSQTAWGLIGLLATGEIDSPAAARAVEFLLSRQSPDGSWDEEAFTGTGFPCVFYLRYHLYRNYFPLYALARYRNLRRGLTPFHALMVRPDQFARRNGNLENG